MIINKSHNGDQLVISLEGRLDTVTAPELQTVLISEFDTVKNVQLDFKQVGYVSSAGLRVLLMGEKTAKAKGGTMTIVNVSDQIQEVFEMTGFSNVLNIR